MCKDPLYLSRDALARLAKGKFFVYYPLLWPLILHISGVMDHNNTGLCGSYPKPKEED